jgi:class 3 adenylate cyclase
MKERRSGQLMSDEALTVPTKHVFIDVVDFSRDRSVEAQSYIVEFLNKIVLLSLEKLAITEEQRLLLPTGDGMCISLLNLIDPYDIHMILALSIIKYIDHFQGADIEEINEKTADRDKVTRVLVSDEEAYLKRIKMREFTVRVGIETNVDNLVIDINGRQNIAGAGINMAQRIMGLADGNQILVSETVYKELSQREKYMRAFRSLPPSQVKHGIYVKSYQFISDGFEGLNTATPTAFETKQPQEKRLTIIAAYYFAHSIRHQAFLIGLDPSTGDFAGEAFLWLLAKDSVEKSEAVTDREKARYEEYRLKQTIEDLYKEINSANHRILNFVHEGLYSAVLLDFKQYFEGYDEYRFLTLEGVKKLKKEWPDIWAELVSDGIV